MSLPLEVPETVSGSLCSDSSFQNFPHPTPTSSFITAKGEQEESRKSNRTKIALRLETRSQGSFLLLSQLCSFTDSQVLRLSYPQRCVREGTSNSSASLSLSARRVKLTL